MSISIVPAIAFTAHLGLSGMGWAHPSIYIEHDGWKTGAYLNSYEEISLFVGRRFGSDLWLDVGVATGYDIPVVGRVGMDVTDTVSLWTVPTPNTVVIGVEVRFDGLL